MLCVLPSQRRGIVGRVEQHQVRSISRLDLRTSPYMPTRSSLVSHTKVVRFRWEVA